TWKASKR
ncbi:pyruvate kinase, barrel domain protein, partial [Vibrio parahaemolyticus V-223/04]